MQEKTAPPHLKNQQRPVADGDHHTLLYGCLKASRELQQGRLDSTAQNPATLTGPKNTSKPQGGKRSPRVPPQDRERLGLADALSAKKSLEVPAHDTPQTNATGWPTVQRVLVWLMPQTHTKTLTFARKFPKVTGQATQAGGLAGATASVAPCKCHLGGTCC